MFENYSSLCSIANIHIIQSDLFIVFTRNLLVAGVIKVGFFLNEYDLIGEYENYFSKMVNEYREKPPSMEEKGV